MKHLAILIVMTGMAAAAPVASPDPETAVHAHLKSYTQVTTEGRKETFKEVHTMDVDGHLKKLEVYRDGKLLDTTDFTWDTNGHMTKRVSKDDTKHATTHEFVITLDKSGRIETVTDGGVKESYKWDAKGGRVVTTTHQDGGKDVVEMTATFDAANHVTKRCTSTAMVTKAVKEKMTCKTSEYDKHGQVTKIDTTKITNTYDKAGQLTKAAEKDGTVKTFTWTTSGDIATVTEVAGDMTSVTSWTYDVKK